MQHGSDTVRVSGSLMLALRAAEELIQSKFGAGSYKEEKDRNGSSFVITFTKKDAPSVSLIVMNPSFTLEECEREIKKIK